MVEQMKSTERTATATQLRTFPNTYYDKHWSREHVYKIIIIKK
jgi:hypothetical protein